MAEPDNIVLEYLRAMRGDMAKMSGWSWPTKDWNTR